MKVFLIFDNRSRTFFAKGTKGVWLKKSSAKSAVMYDLRCLGKEDYLKYFLQSEIKDSWMDDDSWENRHLTFKDQTRYECREYDLENVGYKIV